MGKRGDFTLPGEAGYEALTLELAKKWGADMIRDSDGTQLSNELLDAGYGIYSTVCVIRDHNQWANQNRDKLQQTFLMAGPVLAEAGTIEVGLMRSFYAEQFEINESEESKKYWQVFDRTTEEEIERSCWSYDESRKSVHITGCKEWHRYSVNFMAFRIWEEISMYNHVTNNWDKEHLLQIDPIHPQVQEYLLQWMRIWCEQHPKTSVVRFTSLFYNFVWIWGSSDANRHLFTDWGSYDFTVSPRALVEFEKQFGYSLHAEDFIHQGKMRVTHMPANQKKRDWMNFINISVIKFGKKLVDIVHEYNKLAYVFYDDSWVGLEPHNGKFREFQFDGIIKCVFSGFEARMCAGVPVKTHEIRLHPYLFPVGLGGAPTFKLGGTPTLDAKKYWRNIRRALLRQPVERIGLGGYLHLTTEFPDFNEYIADISDEFRTIKKLHKAGEPHTLKIKVAVLHSWGRMRPWTLSGHFHESDGHDLIHICEALSGMPIDVSFIDFQDVTEDKAKQYDVIINVGRTGDAWSGGNAWENEVLITKLTEWVHKGGTFIGINEPSSVCGYDTQFRMAHVLGVDLDMGDRVNHGKWEYQLKESGTGDMQFTHKEGIYLTNENVEVRAESTEKQPVYVVNQFGEGMGVYLSSFRYSNLAARLLLNLILEAEGERSNYFIPDNLHVECTYFKESDTLVVINNTDDVQKTDIVTFKGAVQIQLHAYETKIVTL